MASFGAKLLIMWKKFTDRQTDIEILLHTPRHPCVLFGNFCSVSCKGNSALLQNKHQVSLDKLLYCYALKRLHIHTHTCRQTVSTVSEQELLSFSQ